MLYKLLRAFFKLIFATFYRWDVQGREHLPRRGPVLICANHIGWWDPPLIACALARKVFMAKNELFHYPVFGDLLRRVGAFPVRRGRPDRRALRRALELLTRGEVVGMFVEGTRQQEQVLGEARPGAAWLAMRARAPILPVLIQGPYRPLRPIRVRIGAAFELAESDDRGVDAGLSVAGQEIMDRIAALRADETPQPEGRASTRRRA